MSGYVTTGNYEVVEYLEATETQYFDTGFTPNQDTGVKCKFKMLTNDNSNSHLFGSGYSYYSNTFECYLWNHQIQFNYNQGYTFAGTINIGDTIEIDWNKNIIKYRINDGDWNTITMSYGNFTTPGSMWVFLNNRTQGSTSVSSKSQLIYFEIYDNGELIKSYKPVQTLDSTSLGLYDTVNDTFITNSGTGEFISGEPTGEYVDAKTSTNLIMNASKDITQLDYDLASCEEGWFSKYTRTDYTSNYSGSTSNATLIITDIPQSQIGYYDVTFQFDEGSFKCIIGVPNDVGGNNYICWYSNALHEGHGGNIIDREPNVTGHKYRLIGKPGNNQSVAYRDGVFLKNYTSSFFLNNPTKLQIMGMSGYSGGKMIIYNAEFRKSEYGEVVGHFVPVIRKSDTKAGFYDMVTKQFYEPLSGSFYPGDKEYHFDYQKFRMYAVKHVEQIDIDIADKVDGWFGDYVRCDCIESNSGAYINTGVLPTPKNFKIEVKGIQIQSRSLFGTNGPGVDEIHFTGNGASFARYCENVAIGWFSYMSGVHIFTLDTGKMYVDGELKTPIKDPDTIPDDSTTLPMFLFSRNKNGSSEDGGNHTIYSAKIWNNGELVRDYIPCIRKSDMKAGLYDLVGKQFYISPNNRDFIPSGKVYHIDFNKY